MRKGLRNATCRSGRARAAQIWLYARYDVIPPPTPAVQQPGADAPPPAVVDPLPAVPLHTDGRWIVDKNGKRFKLASVSWYGGEGSDHVVAGLLATFHVYVPASDAAALEAPTRAMAAAALGRPLMITEFGLEQSDGGAQPLETTRSSGSAPSEHHGYSNVTVTPSASVQS